jgi:hypothetical protein
MMLIDINMYIGLDHLYEGYFSEFTVPCAIPVGI